MTRAGEETKATLERIGALLEADRLGWLTGAAAVSTGRVECEQCGASRGEGDGPGEPSDRTDDEPTSVTRVTPPTRAGGAQAGLAAARRTRVVVASPAA